MFNPPLPPNFWNWFGEAQAHTENTEENFHVVCDRVSADVLPLRRTVARRPELQIIFSTQHTEKHFPFRETSYWQAGKFGFLNVVMVTMVT